MRALTVADLDPGFMHMAQAARIHRRRRVEATGKISRETVHVITNLTSRQASPARMDNPRPTTGRLRTVSITCAT